jgi:hypothetical protein
MPAPRQNAEKTNLRQRQPSSGESTTPMRSKIPAILVLFLGSLCFGSEARGCGCITSFIQHQPCSAYWNSTVVFTGTVTEVGSALPVPGTSPQVFTGNGRVTRFKIQDAFRGVHGETVETFDHGTSCDYGFKLGDSYFVYAARDPKDGKIYVSSCSSTRTLDRAGDDLAYARGAMRGELTPSIVGLISKQTRARADQYRQNTALAGIKVLATGAADTVEAFTDTNGIFRFFKLAPGNYNVRALTPPELRRLYGEEVLKLQVSDGRCSGGEFVVTSLAAIGGRVFTAEGTPAKTRLNLVPIDSSSGEITPAEGTIETHSDEQGRYQFGWLAPGRYLIAVNGRSQPGSYDPPYPRSYYPGVVARDRAAVFDVIEGQQLAVPDFQLPSPLISRTIEGLATWPDGTPAAGALITLEFTEREWIEISSADPQGQFSVKVYEGFKYLVAAEVRRPVQGVWRGTHSTAAEVDTALPNEKLTLVINQPGFYVPRYVEQKKRR